MGTAILRSQDCLRGRLRHEALSLTLSPRPGAPRRSPYFSTANPNLNPTPNHGSNAAILHQSRRRKRSPMGFQPNQHDQTRDRPVVAKVPVKKLVMGQVKILRRGEALNPEKNNRGLGVVAANDRKPRDKKAADPEMMLGSTDRLGPDPDTVQKQIKAAEFKVMDAIYAGSGVFYASPPPSSVPLPAFLGRNGAATSDLRRLLRLDSV